MGFFSSFAKGLLPAPLQGVIDSQKEFSPDPTEVEIAKDAFRQFGHNPEAPWVNIETGQPVLPDSFGYIAWLPPDLAAESLNILGSLSDEQRRSIGFYLNLPKS
jgi:hypothetical protein